MSWTAERRDVSLSSPEQPGLSQQLRERLRRDVLPRYETKLAALLPTLHAVQEANGWISPRAIEEVAAFLEISPAQVLDTASFYEEFRLRPLGRHVVGVCRSIACEFCGSGELTDALREALGIEVGETTEDGAFTLVELECLGSCGSAPVALFDHDLHEFLTPEQALALVEQARSGKRPVVERTTSDLGAVEAHD